MSIAIIRLKRLWRVFLLIVVGTWLYHVSATSPKTVAAHVPIPAGDLMPAPRTKSARGNTGGTPVPTFGLMPLRGRMA